MQLQMVSKMHQIVSEWFQTVLERCHMVLGSCHILSGRCEMVTERTHICNEGFTAVYQGLSKYITAQDSHHFNWNQTKQNSVQPW